MGLKDISAKNAFRFDRHLIRDLLLRLLKLLFVHVLKIGKVHEQPP